jgi:hypothetical protein
VFLKLGECSTLVNFTLKGFFRSATSFQVHGFENSRYQGYDSIADAKAAWEHACACSVIGNPSPKKKKASSVSVQKFSVSHPGMPTKAPTTPVAIELFSLKFSTHSTSSYDFPSVLATCLLKFVINSSPGAASPMICLHPCSM